MFDALFHPLIPKNYIILGKIQSKFRYKFNGKSYFQLFQSCFLQPFVFLQDFTLICYFSFFPLIIIIGMVHRKISSYAEAVTNSGSKLASGESQQSDVQKGKPWVFFLIVGILIVVSIDIVYETSEDISQKNRISEKKSKSCLAEFQNTRCTALQLTDNCTQLLKCIQNDGEPVSERLMISVDFLLEEIKENALFPGLIVVILLLYQLTKGVMEMRHND